MVDVGKLKLDISIDNEQFLTIDNHEKSFNLLISEISGIDNVCVVMEATGGYEKNWSAFYFQKELQSVL